MEFIQKIFILAGKPGKRSNVVVPLDILADIKSFQNAFYHAYGQKKPSREDIIRYMLDHARKDLAKLTNELNKVQS